MIVHLQRLETDRLGFLPYQALVERVGRGQALVATENDDPAAFAVFGGAGACVTIHQTAAMADARRRRLALDLADAVRVVAGRRGASHVRLSCADDLPESLAFWRAAGFVDRARLPAAGTRNRGLVVMRAESRLAVQPPLLDLPERPTRRHPASDWLARSTSRPASAWRLHDAPARLFPGVPAVALPGG